MAWRLLLRRSCSVTAGTVAWVAHRGVAGLALDVVEHLCPLLREPRPPRVPLGAGPDRGHEREPGLAVGEPEDLGRLDPLGPDGPRPRLRPLLALHQAIVARLEGPLGLRRVERRRGERGVGQLLERGEVV